MEKRMPVISIEMGPTLWKEAELRRHLLFPPRSNPPVVFHVLIEYHNASVSEDSHCLQESDNRKIHTKSNDIHVERVLP